MPKPLYFIAILARALEQSDPKAALHKAFDEIRRLGRLPQYRLGYEQFQQFMGEAVQHAGKPNEDSLTETLIDVLVSELSRVEEKTLRPVLVLEGEGVPPRRIRLSVGKGTIGDIVPGHYRLKLSNTGWLLWTRTLNKTELLWSEAYPGRPLALAADTGVPSQEPTREVILLDGEIILRTYPGLELGWLEIEWKGPHG